MDATRHVIGTAGAGDDVASLTAACGGAVLVLVSSPRAEGDRGDMLRLYRVAGRQLIPAASPLELTGTLTALWAAPGATTATAVTRDAATDRYEALQISVACDR